MLDWKRTKNKEFPQEGELCLIFFAYTGFTISRFSYDDFVNALGEVDPSLGKVPVFSDRGGYLGDEDVLWVSLRNVVPEDYLADYPEVIERLKKRKTLTN